MNSLDEHYGYDANFISDVSDSLKCIVCHLVMRQPVQIMTCGHRFCKPCFERLQENSMHFSILKLSMKEDEKIKKSKVFDDTAVSLDIGNLQVTCSYVTYGCSWKGDLRNLTDHEKECQHHINQNMPNQNQVANTENMRLVAELLKRVQNCENMKEKDLALMKCDINEMKRKYDEKEDKITASKIMNEEIRREMDETKKINEKMKKHFKSKIETLEKRNKGLENRLGSLETQTEGDTTVIAGKFNLLETQINANEATIMECKDSLVSKIQLEDFKTDITNKIESLETQIESNQRALVENKESKLESLEISKRKYDEKENGVTALNTMNEEIRREMDETKKINEKIKKHFKSKIETLEKRNKGLETRLGSLEKQTKEDTKVITGKFNLLETQIKTNEATIMECKDSLVSKKQLENFEADITNKIESLETQIESNQTVLMENKELFVSKLESLEILKRNYEEKENGVTELKTMNEEIRREMDETKKIKEKMKEHFKSEIETLDKRSKGLETRLESLETQTKVDTIVMTIKFNLLETQVNANEATIMECKDSLVSKIQLENLKADITNKIESLETQIESNQTALVENKELFVSKLESLEILKRKYDEKENGVTELKTMNEEIRREMDETKKINEKLKEHFKSEIETLDKRSKGLETRLESLETQTKVDTIVMTIKFNLLETQVNANEATIMECKDSLVSKIQLEKFKADITNKIESLETQIESNQTALVELIKSHETAVKENKELLNDSNSNFVSKLESLEILNTTFRKDTILHLENIENVIFCHGPHSKKKNVKIKWVITDFQRKCDSGENIYSPIFYTSLQGYCFKLLVKWSGDDRQNLDLGIKICLNEYSPHEQDGERKDMLQPFRIEHYFEILKKDGSSKVGYVSFEALDRLREKCFTILPNKNEAREGCGKSAMLHKSTLNDFVINDMMYITCTFRTCKQSFYQCKKDLKAKYLQNV